MVKSNILKEFRNGIDGLDIAAIMGLDKNKNLGDVYLEKLNSIDEITKYGGILEKTSEADYWNLTFEEMIAREYSLRSNRKIRKGNKQLIDEEHDFIVSNINRKVVGENSILICKCESIFFAVNWKGEEVPAGYVLEAQHSMRVSKAEKCYVASLLGGKKFVYKEVLRDDKVIDMIVQIEKDFWVNNILNRIPPKE
ncbi:YqaJ viral recombinase family protein [Clostridium sp. C2-6-12]|uniref:YqaJ viral recombinase family nuclease n=1 Tax=Clostridium sp. C2-6-12 TaxID=2698832 RepID=UPI001368376B|nr:YqaJ viral recombinase family protein [Clostridium sp. C2-6-12]